MKQITSQGHDGLYLLVSEKTKVPVERGARPDYFLEGGRAPHHAASTGRIYVKTGESTSTTEYFPSVYGMKWVPLSPA